jgi:hypothetical protein
MSIKLVIIAILAILAILMIESGKVNTGVKRVARIQNPYFVQADPYVQWQPNHKLILLRARKPMGGGGGPDGHYSFGTGFYFLELDPRTGKETPIKGINKHFPPTKDQFVGYWRLSPDGKWLFWPEDKWPRATWFAARLDGTRIVSWPQPTGDAVGAEFPYYAWTPDS